MTNIPFPNPHDAEALNDYLDDLAAGKQTIPESDVETAAQAFHQLASRAEVEISTQQTVEQPRGVETMHTATLAAPVSNRTRRQMAAAEKKPSRSYGWLSAVIVAGLMISMIGSAWLNREPGNPHVQLAFAPGTATAISEDEVLTPESAPWIADFDPADCTETSGLAQVEINYQAMPSGEGQGYNVAGPAPEDNSSAAADQYRAMRACDTLTDAWAYWSEARVNEYRRVRDESAQMELTVLQDHFASVYPNQFMAIAENLTVAEEIKNEWAARVEAGQLGLPIPLDAKINPEWGVELSDGRIAFPATVMYSANDPAVMLNGLPLETPASTVAIIFTLEDGSWKYDDSLQLCLVNCENGVGNPLAPDEAPWAQSPETQRCVRQQLLPELNYSNDLTTIPYENRSYAPANPTSPKTASEIAETVATWNACGYQGNDDGSTYLTPLGTMNMAVLESSSAGDPFDAAPYLRQWERGSSQLVSQTTGWNQPVVLNEPIRNTLMGMEWMPMISGSGPNSANVRITSQGFNPATAVELEDGRVSIFAVPTISMVDRGAVTYEGNQIQQQVAGLILQQHGGVWLIDEPVLVNSGVILHGESDAWWWDESFDEPEVPWTQPVSAKECPDDAKRNVHDPENPGGTMYSREDYDQVSSERSYEIIGPANPEDADAVTTRMREAQGCVFMGKSTLTWTARFEYENRTTAGRESVDAIADERSEGGDSVSTWLEDEFELTYQDVIVYQDPDELTLDGTESVINTRLYNPNLAVEFADGRIGLVPSIVTYEPISAQWDVNSVNGAEIRMQIFVYQDGEWMLDENLPMCIGDCSDLPYGTPMPGVDPMATPMD